MENKSPLEKIMDEKMTVKVTGIWLETIRQRDTTNRIIAREFTVRKDKERQAGIFPDFPRTPCCPECEVCKARGYKYLDGTYFRTYD
jgi:hypothetical protein